MSALRTPDGWRDLLLHQLAHRAEHALTQAQRTEASGQLGAVRALMEKAARADRLDTQVPA